MMRKIFILWMFLFSLHLQAQDVPYQDLQHQSKVFGQPRTYRLYLPEGYAADSRRYPVIYFFHGWGGRYFKDDNAKLDYVALQQLVNKYRFIMVMWDGNIDGVEPRPYNIGNHEDVKFRIQMKDYFPELIAHIDSAYRTVANRNHRGIIGFSMGGIMSLYMGGRYPDKVSAVVSMTGSPEFFIGYPERHTLYPVRYTFRNLDGVRVRMHTSNTDILYWLNEEVRAGADWEGGVSLDRQSFAGGHMVDLPGETKVFESAVRFVTDGFKLPLPVPAVWSHYDVYPDFEVWGYTVESNIKEPGFLQLRHVDRSGFGLYSRRWLPLGPALAGVDAKVSTAAVYTPSQVYELLRYDVRTHQLRVEQSIADSAGRLQVNLPATATEIGIYRKGDPASWIACPVQGFLKSGKLSLQLLNRGGDLLKSRSLQVTVSTRDESVMIADSVLHVKASPGKRLLQLPALDITCTKTPPPHAEPSEVKLQLIIRSGNEVFEDEVTMPVWFDVPAFTNIRIDDGKELRDTAFGRGNGDGVADAGEHILLYQDQHRLRLYTDDPWVAQDEERLMDEMIPARWPDGYSLSSLVKILPGCPKGHVITFIGAYETKTFNPIERKLKWGTIRLKTGD